MKTRMIIRCEKGVAALEFAIVLPFLVLLAVGICEFGILLYNQQVITNASREGARAGITREVTPNEVHGIVTAYCGAHLITFDDGDVEPQTTFVPTDPDFATMDFQADFSVKVTYEYQFLVASLFGLGPTKQIAAATGMKMEADWYHAGAGS